MSCEEWGFSSEEKMKESWEHNKDYRRKRHEEENKKFKENKEEYEEIVSRVKTVLTKEEIEQLGIIESCDEEKMENYDKAN